MNSIPKNEITRKILHLFSSIIPLGYLWVVQDREIMVMLMGCLSLIAIILEIGRRKWNFIQTTFNKWFNFMMRENEFQGNLTGATWLLFGSLVTVFTFPMGIAILALLYMSVGDSFAALVGKSFPIGKLWNKTLSGTLAGTLSCILVGFWINESLPQEIIILSAVGAMLVELIPLPLNDNVTVPLTAGLIMTYGAMII